MQPMMFDKFTESARKKYVPLGGIFELTPRCTLDCKMCYVHLTEAQMQGRKEMDGEDWIKIIDQAIDRGMLFALVTGGECMLHKDFRKIFLYLHERGIITTVNTNATFITDEIIDFFVKNPPNRIKVTLYAMSEDGYEKVTGHRMFARVRDNIMRMKNAGLNVKISVTVCKYNYDEAEHIVKFALDNGFDYTVDMAMHEANDDTGRSSDDYALTGEEIAQKYRDIFLMRGMTPYCYEPVTELPERMDDTYIAKHLRCGAGRQSFSVSWKGMMYPCMWIPCEPQDVLKIGFDEAWKECNRIVDEMIIPIECTVCDYYQACAPCAMRRADPADPRHCNPVMCAATIARVNSGVLKKRDNPPKKPDLSTMRGIYPATEE